MALLAYAQTKVGSFTAAYQGTDVRLEWVVEDDVENTTFEIARKRPDEAVFTRIGSVEGRATGQYSFIDDQLYKSTTANQLAYRLTVRTANGQSSQHFVSIAHNPTAVQRTWGSIKSMFK